MSGHPLRIAIVTESFLPTVNGVSNSVARVTERLELAGHDVLIVAPGRGPDRFSRSKVVRTAAMPLPGYAAIPVGVPTRAAAGHLAAFDPDVVHVAGPVALGAWGVAAARRLGVPAVAVYQTDFPRYTRHYRVAAAQGLAWRWLRHVHGMAARTLAPSTAAVEDLCGHGVPRVHRWARGVDLQRFSPAHRDPVLRRRLTSGGRWLVGYVGRLAPEKDVGLLAALRDMDGVQVVVVGDGPDRQRLQRRLPGVVFTGHRGGADLSRLFASLDLFVHTGRHETFGQALQEALASGVPVVAPAAGGPLDLVTHGRNGLLYTPGDVRSLRHAVVAAVADGAALRLMAQQARAGVAGRDWTAVVGELLGHYRAVLGHRAGRGSSVLDAPGRTPAVV